MSVKGGKGKERKGKEKKGKERKGEKKGEKRKEQKTFQNFTTIIYGLQSFSHEFSLGKAGPPLGGFVRLGIEDFVAEAQSDLLPQLSQVAPHGLLFSRVGRFGVHGVERKSSLARKFETSDRQRMHLFQTLVLGMTPVQFLQALDDVKREINEDAVGLAFDLVVAEENVGFEVHQSLVNDIHIVIAKSSRGCWPLVFGFQRQNGHISNTLAVLSEKGMTSRHLELSFYLSSGLKKSG